MSSDGLQIGTKRSDENSSLVHGQIGSNLIARGRRDAANLCNASQSKEELGYTYWKRGRACLANDREEAIKWFLRAADLDDPESKIYLGLIHYDCKNYSEAVKWLRQAVPTETGVCEFCLSDCYFYGKGVQQDYSEATIWLVETLDSERGDEDNWIGLRLDYIYTYHHEVHPIRLKSWPYSSDDYSRYIEWSIENANAGSTLDQFAMGLAYLYGRGIMQDDTEAVNWFHRAATNGNPHAQFHLGLAYAYGRGAIQDYVQALLWIGLAAPVFSGDWETIYRFAQESIASKLTPEQIIELAAKERSFRANLR